MAATIDKGVLQESLNHRKNILLGERDLQINLPTRIARDGRGNGLGGYGFRRSLPLCTAGWLRYKNHLNRRNYHGYSKELTHWTNLPSAMADCQLFYRQKHPKARILQYSKTDHTGVTSQSKDLK
ncbi:MAG: hypothetical protein WCL39_05600 [Armatimonadota bacterium]